MRKKEGLMMLGITGMIALGGLGVWQTNSYFTQKDTVTNVFTVGDLDVDLREPEWNPEDGDGQNIYPGYTVYKNPTVKNAAITASSTQPCYLKMVVNVLDRNGEKITDKKRLELIRKTIRYDASYTGSWEKTGTATGLTEGKTPGYSEKEIESYPMVNPDFEELESGDEKWVFAYKGGDKGILQVDEETTLFTSVAIPTEWTAEDLELLGEYQLQISAYAIQTGGFANRTEAFSALASEK